MAIKYYCMPEKGKVIAVLTDCKYDAVNKIDKICMDTDFYFMCDEKFYMPNSFKATAQISGGDMYDEAIGKKIAREKLMNKYYTSFDKRMAMFNSAITSFVNKAGKK